MNPVVGARSRWPSLLALVVLAGVALRVIAILVVVQVGYSPVRGDAITYDGLAQSLAAGQGYVRHGQTDNVRPPAYPFVLSLVYRAVGHRPLAGALAQALFDGITIATLAGLTLYLTASTTSALLAALLLASWPGAVFLNLTLYTEPFYTAVLVLATFALMRLETAPGAGWAVGTGLLWGLACLTRQTALLFLPLYAGLGSFLHRAGGRRTGARLLAVAVCVLALTPWSVRDVVRHGRLGWIEDYNGLNLWIGGHLPLQGRAIDREALARIYERMGERASDMREVNRELRKEAIRSLREHPVETAWLWVLKAERFLFVDLRPTHLWVRVLLSLVLLAVYAAAIHGARGLPRGSGAALGVIIAVIGYALIVHVVSYSQMRFAEPTRPLFFALAGHGLARWWETRRSWGTALWARARATGWF